jgi:transcriptional regulator with PAS, ATPase and Fis domain
VPPLRDRFDDLPLLVDHFVKLAADELGKKVLKVPNQLYPLLKNYSFPGNIRELQTIILDGVSRQNGSTLGLNTIEAIIFKGKSHGKDRENRRTEDVPMVSFGSVLPTMTETRHLLIKEAMERAGGNISLAAKFIGITRQSFSQFLKRHSLSS